MRKETIAAAALIGLVPLGLWGPTAPQGHVYSLIIAAMACTALFLPNPWLRAGGMMVSGWLAAGVFMSWVGMIDPGVLMQFIDGSLMILMGLMVYLFVYHARLDHDTVLNIVCITALFQTGLAVLQFYNMDPVSRGMSYFVEVHGDMAFSTPVGTLANNNFLGAYLAISLPLFLRRNWAYALPVILFGLYITKTASALGAAAVALGWWAFGGGGALFGIGVGIIAYFWTGHDLTNPRFIMWADAVKGNLQTWQTALVGWGPGIAWRPDNMLHSEYVTTFFNYGALGLAILAGYLKGITQGDRALSASLLAAAVNMAGNHPLHTVPTAVLIVTIAALWERERHGNA